MSKCNRKGERPCAVDDRELSFGLRHNAPQNLKLETGCWDAGNDAVASHSLASNFSCSQAKNVFSQDGQN